MYKIIHIDQNWSCVLQAKSLHGAMASSSITHFCCMRCTSFLKESHLNLKRSNIAVAHILQLVSVGLREFCTPKQCDDQADTVSLVGRTGGSLSHKNLTKYNGEKGKEQRQSSKAQSSVLLLWPTLQMPEDVVRLRLLDCQSGHQI